MSCYSKRWTALVLPLLIASMEAGAGTSRHIVTLAASCAACHGTHGNSVDGTPVLAGLDPSYFASQMRAFQANKRASTVMHHLSQGLTSDEIEQLGLYFARQPRAPAQLPKSPSGPQAADVAEPSRPG